MSHNLPPPPPQHQQHVQNAVTIKVAILGDDKTGKTSLMIKYVNNTFDPRYKKTLGVNFMEKNIQSGTTDIKFSIYDLGGAKEFENMLPLTTNDAVSLVLVFDLTDRDSLTHLKSWYRSARATNQNAIPIIVGTKYDLFIEKPREYQQEIHRESLAFAKSLKSSLIFTSSSDSINVQKVFKVLMSKAFDLQLTIPEISNVGEPLLLFNHI